MVGQQQSTVNTGFYGIDCSNHTQHGCFPFPNVFLYSATPQENIKRSHYGLSSVHTGKTFNYKPLVEGPA